MATKEEIAAAARGMFRVKEIEIRPGTFVGLRELTTPERNALDRKLWQVDEAGELKMRKEGDDDFLVSVPHNEEWLAATMTPAFTVDELLAGWPAPLKAELAAEAKKLNTATLKDAVGNS
jgi:hypothetical protein